LTHAPRPFLIGGVLAFALFALSGCSSGPKHTYGSTPAFLPSSAITPDSVLTGTAARPALTSEGDSVRVQQAQGSVLATVLGPEVPGEGLPHVTPTTTCTWTVTMRSATGRVPLRVADFTALDHLGGLSHPGLVPGTAVPPSILTAGQTVSFELRAVMRTGEGLIRWAPGSSHVLASWDFTVEND
jgi:hypothetical protein